MERTSRVISGAFGRLLMSETLNTTSSSILTIAAPLAAITMLDANAFEVGLLAGCSMAAPLVFGLSAGAIADRLDRKSTLLWCGLARIALVAAAAALFALGHISIIALAAIGFALSTVKLLFDIVAISVVPTIVTRENLTKANSWYEAANSAAYTGGPAMAGWLLQLLPAAAVYGVGAALYVVSTCALRRIPLSGTPRANQTSQSHLSDIADSVRLLWRNEIQRAIALAAGMFNLFHAAFFTIFAYYAITQLDFSAASYGTLISIVGCAGLLAALCAPKLVDMLGARTTLISSLLLIGPLGMPILFADGLPFLYRGAVIVLCLATWDFMIVLHLIVEQTIRQATVDAHCLGRINATTRFVSWGADPIGAVLGGLMASTALGSKGALLLCLLGFVISGAMLLASRSIRSLSVTL